MLPTLAGLCSFTSGGTPTRQTERFYRGTVPWLSSADITEDGGILHGRTLITQEAIEESATSAVPPGTVLLVTRTGVGKVAVADRELCFSQDITALRPDQSRLDADYLAAFLRSRQQLLLKRSRGATIKGVPRAVVEQLEIPLPPLDVQRRIVAALAAAHELRDLRANAIQKGQDLQKAVFGALLSGWG